MIKKEVVIFLKIIIFLLQIFICKNLCAANHFEDRVFQTVLPDHFDKNKEYPLIVFLHGYMSDASHEQYYIGLKQQTKLKDFILLLPNGLKNSKGLRFWNANKYCCDYEKNGVDDINFIKDLIIKVKKEYLIDKSKIFLFGHSNGAALAYEIACKFPSSISGIVAYAGSSIIHENTCDFSSGFRIIHIHGTGDTIVPYLDNDRYAAVEKQLDLWKSHKNCTQYKEENQKYNFLIFSFYNQTDEKKWFDCNYNDSVLLWKMNDIGHISVFSKIFLETLFQEIGIKSSN